MKQQTAIEYFDEQLQEYVIAQDNVLRKLIIEISFEDYMNLKKQAKEMEKQQHDRINEFFNTEKILGISDVKTIERIQWYYNTYFNNTHGTTNGSRLVL